MYMVWGPLLAYDFQIHFESVNPNKDHHNPV